MPLEKLQVSKTFLRLTSLDNLVTSYLSNVHKIWSFNFFHNRTREFLFKFVNNGLGLNSRLVHFVEEIDPSCTLCSVSNIGPACVESFVHLFFIAQ